MKNGRVPAFCPLCSLLMKGHSTITFLNSGVCVTCFIYFVEGREKRWESGWRPSKEEVECYLKSLDNE